MAVVPKQAVLALLDGAGAAQAGAALGRMQPAERRRLLDDADDRVPAAVLRWTAEHGTPYERATVAKYPYLPRDVRAALAHDPHPALRNLLYFRSDTPGSLRRTLLADDTGGLRARLMQTEVAADLGPALDSTDAELAAHAREHALSEGLRAANTPDSLWDALGSVTVFGSYNRHGAVLATLRPERWTRDDWTHLARRHTGEPLKSWVAAALALEPSCPADVLPRLVAARNDVIHRRSAWQCLTDGLLAPDDLVDRVPYAARMLRLVRELFGPRLVFDDGPWLDGATARELHGILHTAVRTTLGTDPRRWNTAAGHLIAETPFAGSIADLLADESRSPYPPLPAGRSGPALGYLLSFAEPGAVHRIVAGLDTPALAELINPAHHDVLPPAIAEAVVGICAADHPDLLRRLAMNHKGDPHVVPLLRRLRDPEIDVLIDPDHPRVAGKRRDRPDWPAKAVASYDLDLVEEMLAERSDRLAEAHLALACRRLAEAGRLDALAAFTTAYAGRFPEPVRAAAAALAEHPGDTARITAAIDRHIHDVMLAAARLGTFPRVTISGITAGFPVPWDALLSAVPQASAAHVRAFLSAAEGRIPLDDTTASRLVELLGSDAPSAAIAWSRDTALAALRSPLPGPGRHLNFGSPDAEPWATLLADGVITPEEYLTEGHDAELRLGTVYRHPYALFPIQPVLRRLVDAHLGSNPDAWAVAIRTSARFPGTITELLATAGAMTTPAQPAPSTGR
ncbi:hypothetical protein [Yinghuangia soli]|uniref:Uncharacterized protein n=1 Tax=Yinghuangia soli TaxID=2908204 RepID=A0AA41Q6H2_9ACTN|nr:hypothetical protein [Yinghuangia soli]MCF2532403.1 hypothetical protein [Yinghuangia soli]